MEASTAFTMAGVPHPFPPPQCKRKKVVWLRENNLNADWTLGTIWGPYEIVNVDRVHRPLMKSEL